jgi:hypothetical protein
MCVTDIALLPEIPGIQDVRHTGIERVDEPIVAATPADPELVDMEGAGILAVAVIARPARRSTRRVSCEYSL